MNDSSSKRVIYLMADNRTGSTLLDQLLGAHERIVSLGEVHQLAAYANEDRRIYNPSHPLLCSCGERLSMCPFWKAVELEVGQPLGELQLKLRFFDFDASDGSRNNFLRRRIRQWLKAHPRTALLPGAARALRLDRVGADSFSLFSAIHAILDCDYLVDSSKLPYRMLALYRHCPDRVRVLMLTRHPLGTVHSKMKRGMTLEAGARGWAERMRQMGVLASRIDPRHKLTVRYEELCREPERVLGQICGFLGVEFASSMLVRPTSDIHHIGGSPSKFDPGRRKIELDEQYLGAFAAEQVAKLDRIVTEQAHRWGYDAWRACLNAPAARSARPH